MLALCRSRDTLFKSVRLFFSERDYLEVETPTLVQCPGSEIFLQYFQTHWLDLQQKSQPYFLRSSPELSMKRLILRDVPRIYQLGKCFRNAGELGDWHQPEFTMLEWYCCNASLDDCLTETLHLLTHCAQAFAKNHNSAQNLLLALKSPQYLNMDEAFSTWAGLELKHLDAKFLRDARTRGFSFLTDDDNAFDAYGKIYYHVIEPQLRLLPFVILRNFPSDLACLSQKNMDGWSARFEMLVHGVELCNAFQELNTAQEHHRVFTHIDQQRQALGFPQIPQDAAYLSELASLGPLPKTAGNALGFDRLLAILLGEPQISRTMCFPLRGT